MNQLEGVECEHIPVRQDGFGGSAGSATEPTKRAERVKDIYRSDYSLIP